MGEMKGCLFDSFSLFFFVFCHDDITVMIRI